MARTATKSAGPTAPKGAKRQTPVHLDATEARQGLWGWDVLAVLIVSTALAILALAAAVLVRTDDLRRVDPNKRVPEAAASAAGDL